MPKEIEHTSLPKEDFFEIRDNIFLRKKDFEAYASILDIPIYRYINFDMLYNLLNDKLIVWRKGGFSDLHECGKNQNPFGHQLKCVGVETTSEDINRWNNIEAMRINTADWLTTCFSKDANNDYFFWRCYTSNWLGARYKTTLAKILDNLVLDDKYSLIIGSMQYYETEYYGNNLSQYIFHKINAYKHEQELRIYFIPKEPNLVQNKNSSVEFHINSYAMIEDILFSPFSSHHQRATLSQLFKLRFPLFQNRMDFSRIIEKQK